MSTEAMIGQPVLRVEDDRLLRGQGRFIDDIHPRGCREAAFLRSPHAHARIVSLDDSRALALPGVDAVLHGTTIASHLGPMVFDAFTIVHPAVRASTDTDLRVHPMPVLPVERVSYFGQAIAMVVANDRYIAEDALELIDVEYELLPAVVSPEDALASDAPRVEPEWPDNVALSFSFSKGDPNSVFANADVIVEERFTSHRYVGAPIETRGVIAERNAVSSQLTVWSTTPVPHLYRDVLARSLCVDPHSVRVIASDVGGGFGVKSQLYPEDLLVPLAATLLDLPVKWTEDRVEHIASASHGREQVHRISIAATGDGRIGAVRDDVIVNSGAFNTLGLIVPYNTFTHLLGPYDIRAAEITVRAVLTNTMWTAPFRGAGRPEAVFALERAIDRLARTLELDPADVRARNLIPRDAMPYATGLVYRDGTNQVYDSGDYPELLRQARDAVGSQPRTSGRRHVGVGYAAYVEGTGIGPFESAHVRIAASGRVTVSCGSTSQGQGHRTTFGQIAADVLGARFDDIDVIGGDTQAIAHGFGTVASRSTVAGGNAIATAAATVRDHALALAAQLLEESVADLQLVDSAIRVRGTTAPLLTLGDVAGALSPYNPQRPPDAPVELEATSVFRPTSVTYAAGIHAAVVAVDTRTGGVEVLRYVVAHDCGRPVNPALIEGQIIGGVVQGIGGALLEEIVYDDEGLLQNSGFASYRLPTAAEVPELVLTHVDLPSPLNPLGVKGVGEGGPIGAPAAIANAVEDALTSLGVIVRSCPLSPERIQQLIADAADASSTSSSKR